VSAETDLSCFNRQDETSCRLLRSHPLTFWESFASRQAAVGAYLLKRGDGRPKTEDLYRVSLSAGSHQRRSRQAY